MNCSLCHRPLDIPGEPDSRDCGGDCWGCMRKVEGHADDCQTRSCCGECHAS
jgi:hypothetical protein